jgi:cytochrome c oxidase subunit 4
MPGPVEGAGRNIPADMPGEQGPLNPDRREEHPGHALEPAAVSSYVTVWGALIGLTFLTVGASYLPLGNAPPMVHTLIAMAIAAAKASLVLLFFMHLWHSPRLTWLVAFGSLLWLAIMMVLTWADYWSRDWHY